ncbi:LON peptidase substrate-binding domain-containing protein [Flavihumibacter fluvii]|uniref:LON peptidase substrate-binding domain-containing protein n=1 Tax=Flavihumibacter fluvii TaxID=2838157 RepID=UPI001BDE88CB|nr:LON peptidase substrate-binding domain-containing protein [Flavihumibacter fluvii]ULQ51459.1 LON peptidase substrate-binding domain-containing protein [Flavihumibacter fluvii]
MTNFIPVFPLGIVVYPQESLNLHIFEPRYKQLINECVEQKKMFGIPTVLQQKVGELGTLVRVTEISKTYENGEMDIKTEGVMVFRILEMVKTIPGKLYSGAIVNYPENIQDAGKRDLMQRVLDGIRELHRMLQVQKEFKKPDDQLVSYDVAHHAGMSVEDEYELLGLWQEVQRQEFLKRHLVKVLPVIAEMEQLKEKVKLNGHFKNLSSLDLDV